MVQRVVLVVVLVVLAIPGGLALAQGGLNPEGTPGYGVQTLAEGFLPDPLSIPMTVLGTLDVQVALGSRCRGLPTGYAASSPDYRITYTGPGGPLRFFFVGRQDAVLIVQYLRPGESAKKGEWYCDDDSGGRQHPMITLLPAEPGVYNIWVGSAVLGQTISGSLYVTASTLENPEQYVASQRALLPPGDLELLPGLAFTAGRAPLYGQALVQPAVAGDPSPVALRAGGRAVLSAEQRRLCVAQDGEADAASGYFTLRDTPDYAVTFEPYSPFAGQPPVETLRLFFVAEDGDSTLVVTDGRGNWFCDDDAAAIAGTSNPALTLTASERTTFYVWVGAYNPGEYVAGLLYAATRTDLAAVLAAQQVAPPNTGLPDGQGGGGAPPVTGTPNPGLLALTASPLAGTLTLGRDFLPDPYLARTAVAGEVSAVAALGGLCSGEADGYLSAAPAFAVAYTAGQSGLLRFFFLAADDAVLAVRAPGGQWFCDDDAGGDLDPLVDIPTPASGTYLVWLGSYDLGNYVSGLLYVTGQANITPASQR